ncbi:hypothetical protein KI688_004133 [Linnemannia hyalina]|uniref:sn-1-specific diacylglycerol lipase n=1 Tax=Linnemannia hyalina TaxID=64524 RepID=A0A9P7XQA6_9FUNG|nr:hypothetical protein KI688_004133 [Linnemannia hyalina]
MPALVSLSAVPADQTIRTETILTEGVDIQSFKVSKGLSPNSSKSSNVRAQTSSLPRLDSGASFMTHATNTGLVLELVPEYISFRLRSVSCRGFHDKTQVTMKLQNISQSTKAAKNLGDHTHQSFDFVATVHNMTFDILKIDVYDYKKAAFGQNAKIGRAYLPLRDLQKKVGNAYDNDGDDNTEPEQSVLSTRFDAAAFCQKHDDIFEMDLPLYKHGSYSMFGSSRHQHHHSDDENVFTKGSETGQDIAVPTPPVRQRPARANSFAQNAMNGVEVGMVTVQATLHFQDQTKNPAFAHLGKGPTQQQQQAASSISNASISESSDQGGLHRTLSQKSRTKSNQSLDSIHSDESSTLGVNHVSCSSTTSDTFPPEGVRNSTNSSIDSPAISSLPRPIPIDGPTRVLRTPSSPPNLSLHRNGGDPTVGSPISPPLSPTFTQTPGSPGSPETSFQWLTDNSFPQATTISNWDALQYSDGFVDDADDDERNQQQEQRQQSIGQGVKGEHLTQSDRDKEEDMMANIMANGDQAKKDMYLRNSQATHAKSKKAKINFFSEQTRSAFKDIQLMYSSFFGHGWNLSRSEFWRGFHVVQQFYARHPTPTTNKAFDDIEILEHARHFVRLAIASYGSLPWVYFGYSFKVAPLNFVRINSDRKNVQDYFKLNKDDMIVWHFDKRTALVPSYYIVRDPKYNALCIIIRGTFSITDAMTDLVCEYYPYKGGLVHKGIMDNARFVLERSGKDIETALRKFNLKTIYCIGHSLGAGSASLLCSLLQDHFADYLTTPTTELPTPQNLEVKAYLFAPPPIATPNLAAQWERTQIAFINENDIVGRLSYGNALDLKELIKIGAIESLNPAYEGLSAKEKLDRILKVLEEAQKRLQAVNDVPRLVTAGTVTYLHKVYEDTPVVKNKKGKGRRDSQFGLPENWAYEESSSNSGSHQANGGGRARGMSASSTTSNNPLVRSISVLSSALSLKGNNHGHGHGQAQHSRQTTVSTLGGSTRAARIVTPYQTGQPAVRLESSVSLALSDLNERHKEISQPQPPQELQQQESLAVESESPPSESRRVSATSFGPPVQYEGSSDERAQATESILQQSRQGQQPPQQHQKSDTTTTVTPASPSSTSEFDDDLLDGNDSSAPYDSDDNRTYTTTKPKKNGSKKKEIRIEFSDKRHFMAIPLRTNWLWHHFPQQYDSRIERALEWAKALKEKEEKRQSLRASRQPQQPKV